MCCPGRRQKSAWKTGPGNAPITVSRVGMGDAWYLGEVHARTTSRGRARCDLRPEEWLNFRVCRVALSL